MFLAFAEEYQLNNATGSDKSASVPLMHLVCKWFIFRRKPFEWGSSHLYFDHELISGETFNT